MLENVSVKLKNDIYFSTCFTILFTSYVTQSHIQKTLTVSIQNENKDYAVDGYVCFGIIYSFFALAMWSSPAVLVILGRKLSMMIGCLCYIPFATACYFESVFFTYASAAITGIGAALLWSGQANYLILNSPIGDVYQSISIFWMLYQSCNFFGNAFVYFQFHDTSAPIDRAMRLRIALTLSAFIVLAFIMMCFVPPPIRHEEDSQEIRNPLSEIKKAFKILISRTCLVLCIMFFYVGIHLSFSSVAGASMGFSKYLSANSKELAPLSGVYQGIGQIVGCAFALYVTKKRKSDGGLRIILMIAGLVNMVAYVVFFLCLPDSSTFAFTDEHPIIALPIIFPILSHVLIGAGDALVSIELYQCLGILYPRDSVPAFCIFKFIRSVAAGIGFLDGNLFGLHTQIIILGVVGTCGIVSYHYIMRKPPSTGIQSDDYAVEISCCKPPPASLKVSQTVTNM